MGKYIDIKLFKKIKIYRFSSGVKQDGGRWALFSYTPYEKDEKGNVMYGQEYTIFIDNIDNVNRTLKDGDTIEVKSINSVSAKDNTYKGKDNVQHTKRVIQVSIDIVIDNNMPNNNNSFNNGYNIPQGNNNQNEDNNPPVFEGGYDMPNF